MARTAVCCALAFLFLANSVSSEIQKGADGAGETVVRVASGAPLTVECGLRAEQRAEWRRDGGPLPGGLRAEEEAAGVDAAPGAADGRVTARLRATAARAHHAGLYTCTPERDQRVRVLVQHPADAPAPGNIAPALVDEGSSPLEDVLYDVRSNITLRCGVDAGAGGSIVWRKNGTVLEEVWEMKDRYSLERGKLEMHVARALEDDFGNYSCALPSQPPANRWQVRARPHLKLPANTNVVEGQKLKLTCKVVGKPYPRVNWGYTNSSEENANFTALNAEEGRITLSTSEQGVPDGTLVVEAAERTDAGRYRCSVEGSTVGETLLRVKDKYAALWPFLGICAEVFVLCAIILVYEKRRTKPDLDDSDTDNHDQKKS